MSIWLALEQRASLQRARLLVAARSTWGHLANLGNPSSGSIDTQLSRVFVRCDPSTAPNDSASERA